MKELKDDNQKLREDIEHITELSRQRRDFFAAASHELKTSIIILKGQIESMILGIGKYKDTGSVLPETLKEVKNMERLPVAVAQNKAAIRQNLFLNFFPFL